MKTRLGRKSSVLRCICIMSGGSTFFQQCFTFDLFKRGANREQTSVSLCLAVCLQQYAHNFSSFLFFVLFFLQDQSKLTSQGCWVGKTCNMCTENWMVFQHWPSFSSSSSNTLILTTLLMQIQIGRFKAWPANRYIQKARDGFILFFLHEQGLVVD